jgi:hypothetical protein
MFALLGYPNPRRDSFVEMLEDKMNMAQNPTVGVNLPQIRVLGQDTGLER